MAKLRPDFIKSAIESSRTCHIMGLLLCFGKHHLANACTIASGKIIFGNFGRPDLRRLVEGKQLPMQPRQGNRCHAHLLAMCRAGMGFACKHVDPMGDLVFAHGAGMGRANQVVAETRQHHHPVEIAVRLNRMFGNIRRHLAHLLFIFFHLEKLKRRGAVSRVKQPVRRPPFNLRNRPAKTVTQARSRQPCGCCRTHRKIDEHTARRLRCHTGFIAIGQCHRSRARAVAIH